MSLRYQLGVLVVALAAIQSGCCCVRPAPWPCGKTYYDTMCGCFYWHEWFSHKPQCCDPCDTCGMFTESSNPYVKSGPPYTRFGALYSDGSGSNAPGAIGQMYPSSSGPTPAEPVPSSPTPAAEPEGVLDEVTPEMTPGEELPGPTTSLPRGAYPRTASRGGPVDSPRYSRTLGRPPRTGLFTR